MGRLLLFLSLTLTSPALAENTITAVGAGISLRLGNGMSDPTVYRAEFGDGPSDLTSPRRARTPPAEAEPSPIFRGTTFVYGEGLRYRPRTQEARSVFDYEPGTRLRRGVYQPEAGQWMRRRYEGTGERQGRRGAYRPDIRYGENLRRPRRPHRFGDN